MTNSKTCIVFGNGKYIQNGITVPLFDSYDIINKIVYPKDNIKKEATKAVEEILHLYYVHSDLTVPISIKEIIKYQTSNNFVKFLLRTFYTKYKEDFSNIQYIIDFYKNEEYENILRDYFKRMNLDYLFNDNGDCYEIVFNLDVDGILRHGTEVNNNGLLFLEENNYTKVIVENTTGFSEGEISFFIDIYNTNKSKYKRILSKYKNKTEEINTYIKHRVDDLNGKIDYIQKRQETNISSTKRISRILHAEKIDCMVSSEGKIIYKDKCKRNKYGYFEKGFGEWADLVKNEVLKNVKLDIPIKIYKIEC